MRTKHGRTFTIHLTNGQFAVLARAVHERMHELDEPDSKGERLALDRAWNEVSASWHRASI